MEVEFDMSAEEYALLYKRFLNRPPEVLLCMAKMKEGDKVLDLCSGISGRLSKAAEKMGASQVVTVDIHKDIWKLREGNIYPVCNSIEGFLWCFVHAIGGGNYSDYLNVRGTGFKAFFKDMFNLYGTKSYFDVVACQQGVNYWFSDHCVLDISQAIKPGGRFIFNTFNKEPVPDRIVSSSYEIGGKNYMEVYNYINGIINHVQIVDSMKPHVSSFRWISKEEYAKTLSPYFDVEVKTEKNADIYVCTRKGNKDV